MRRWLAFLFCRRGHWWSDPVGYSETRFCRVCGVPEVGLALSIKSLGIPFERGVWAMIDQYGYIRKAEPPKGGV